MARAQEISTPLGFAGDETASASIERVTFIVENMSCGGCMRSVEKAAGALGGVRAARANLSAKRLTVQFDPSRIDCRKIIDGLGREGFRAAEMQGAPPAARPDRDLLRRLAIAGFAAANIMLLSVSVWAGAASDMATPVAALFHWLSALIALPTVAYAGQPFFGSALDALRARRLNMDVPISLAILLATAMSLYQTMRGGQQIYFDAAVTLLFFLLIGRYLDRRMRMRAQGAAQNLMGLRASRATVLDPDGATRSIKPNDVARGDLVLVAAGEAIPVDGTVRSGSGDVDESLITGESRPRTVRPGDTIYAGTVNLSTPLKLAATAADETTLLAELARLMEAAEQGKGRYVRLADRAAGIYAPVVHILGALTFLGWMVAGAGWQLSLTTAIAVLIITCPCALALAVPTVQVAAAARLFANGIVLKSGDGLERLAEVDTIVFDKTGTVTLGRPELVNVNEIDDAVLLRAARLAAMSRHPYSQAISRAADERGLTVLPADDVEEFPGAGLQSAADGQRERLGSADWCDVDAPAEVAAALYYRQGRSPAVAFVFEDRLRADSVATIRTLAEAGFDVKLVSGDHADAVARASRALNIEAPLAARKPDEKIAFLETLRRQGRVTLMVGDGLNDAPSLAAAHASLSPSSAAEISQQASDAVFQGERLAPVIEALTTARQAKRLALQNFALAALYNAVCIPLAAAGFVTPLIAAIAMSTSSIVVTANALRLRTQRLELRL